METKPYLRGDVLRDVVRACERRKDGLLPMDVPGVAETFRDEATLLGALQLRWFTRLSARIERRLAKQPDDPRGAVIRSWVATARRMNGVRAVLDHYRTSPTSEEMAEVIAREVAREHELLALSARLAEHRGGDVLERGAEVEQQARAEHTVHPPRGQQSPQALVARLKAVLAA